MQNELEEAETDKAVDAQSEYSTESDDLTRRIVLHVYDDESKEFTSLTTYHGMIRIYSSATWPSRIFWSLVVVTCLTLFMIHSGLMLFFYHSRPTFMKTLDSPVQLADLPAITFCRIADHPGDHQWKIAAKLLGIPPAGPVSLEYVDIGKHIEDMKPNCHDLVSSLRFNGHLIDNHCKYFNLILTEVGYCFKLEDWENSLLLPGLKTATDNQVTDPLEIVFKRNKDELLFEVHARNGSSEITSKGQYLRRGTYNSILAETVHQDLLEKSDWGTCRSSALVDGSVYDQTKCKQQCKEQNYQINCQCSPFYATRKQSRTCSLTEMTECLQKVAVKCDCPVECHSTFYEITSVTQMKWRKHNNSTLLQVNFKEKKKEVTQLKRIKAVDLLSFVAGSMGLFLGMSCVTLLEIFIYLFKSIWGTLNDERHKMYFENLIGSTMDDQKEEVTRSYEQIVITTKVHGDEIEGTPLEMAPRGSVIEENYAITRNNQTRKPSIYRMGPRLSIQESRDGSEHEGSLDSAGGVRIQVMRPAGVRRKSIYQSFGNF